MAYNITHDKKYQQFSVALDGEEEEAELAYATPSPTVLDFTHTYVPESARGKGIANELIEAGMAFARDGKYKVQATCPVVVRYLEKHPEHHDLLQK